MEPLLTMIDGIQDELILILFGCVIVLTILLFITMMNLSLFKSKYKKLNKGHDGKSFDEHILSNRRAIEKLSEENQEIERMLESHQIHLDAAYTKMKLHRYNAFEHQGGQLSFILVLLNEHRDGVIMHNIHNNDFSYLYVKQVLRGTTKETLTQEEKQVLMETIQQKK